MPSLHCAFSYYKLVSFPRLVQNCNGECFSYAVIKTGLKFGGAFRLPGYLQIIICPFYNFAFCIWGRLDMQKKLLIVVCILRVYFLTSCLHESSTFNSDSVYLSRISVLPCQMYNYIRKIYLNLAFQDLPNNFTSYNLFMNQNSSTRNRRLEFCCTRLKLQ